MTEKEKQIEEMAKITCRYKDTCINYKRVCSETKCENLKYAEALYNAGYRKHVDGEWKETCVQDVFQCTNCKRPTKMDELCDSEILRAYCPNCGARMR